MPGAQTATPLQWYCTLLANCNGNAITWALFGCIPESGLVSYGPGAESEAAMVVSGRMRRWLVLVAVAALLPLVGGLVGHWLAGGRGASGAVVMFSCLALACGAWCARQEQETDVTE